MLGFSTTSLVFQSTLPFDSRLMTGVCPLVCLAVVSLSLPPRRIPSHSDPSSPTSFHIERSLQEVWKSRGPLNAEKSRTLLRSIPHLRPLLPLPAQIGAALAQQTISASSLLPVAIRYVRVSVTDDMNVTTALSWFSMYDYALNGSQRAANGATHGTE